MASEVSDEMICLAVLQYYGLVSKPSDRDVPRCCSVGTALPSGHDGKGNGWTVRLTGQYDLEKTTTSFCAMVESTSSLAELIAAGEEEENEAPSLNDVMKATGVVLCAN